MIERVKPAVYFEGMSIIRVKREAGGSRDPKSDEKGNLHILQFLTSDFELDKKTPQYAVDLTLTVIRGSGSHNPHGAGSKQEEGG